MSAEEEEAPYVIQPQFAEIRNERYVRVRIGKHHRTRRRRGDHPFVRIDLKLAATLGGNACVSQIQAHRFVGLLDVCRGPAPPILVQIGGAALPVESEERSLAVRDVHSPFDIDDVSANADLLGGY